MIPDSVHGEPRPGRRGLDWLPEAGACSLWQKQKCKFRFVIKSPDAAQQTKANAALTALKDGQQAHRTLFGSEIGHG